MCVVACFSLGDCVEEGYDQGLVATSAINQLNYMRVDSVRVTDFAVPSSQNR